MIVENYKVDQQAKVILTSWFEWNQKVINTYWFSEEIAREHKTHTVCGMWRIKKLNN